MRLLLLTIAAAVLFIPAAQGVITWTPNVNNGGGGGGGQLPACNSRYWGFEIDGVQGHDWYCYWGSDHWTIIR